MQSDVRRTRRQSAPRKNGRLRVQPVPGLRAWEMAKCACPPRPVMRSRVFQPPAASAFSRFLAAPFCGRGKAALFSAGRPNLPSLSNLPEKPPPCQPDRRVLSSRLQVISRKNRPGRVGRLHRYTVLRRRSPTKRPYSLQCSSVMPQPRATDSCGSSARRQSILRVWDTA